VDRLEAKLEQHLKEVRFKLGAKYKIDFWHPSSGKEVYQIVVPVAAASKVTYLVVWVCNVRMDEYTSRCEGQKGMGMGMGMGVG